jgi:hypothetical protein
MINVLVKETNQVIGFPDVTDKNTIESVVRGDQYGEITQAKPNWYKDNVQPVLEKWGGNLFQPTFMGAKVEPDAARAFGSTLAKEASFGLLDSTNKPVNSTSIKEHPVAAWTGSLAGQTAAIFETAGLGGALGLGKAAEVATKAAGPAVGAITSNAGVGALYGAITEGVKELNKAVKNNDSPDLIKVGEAALKDAGIFGAYGAAGALIPSIPVATATISGMAYTISKMEGASEEDALLNAGVMGAFHFISSENPGKGISKNIIDRVTQMKADYIKAMNPAIHDEIVNRTAQEHTMTIESQLKDIKKGQEVVKDDSGNPITLNIDKNGDPIVEPKEIIQETAKEIIGNIKETKLKKEEVTAPNIEKNKGESGQFNPDMIPLFAETKDVVEKGLSEIKKTFTPYSASPEGKIGAEVQREHLGQMARAHDLAESSLEKAKDTFNKLSNDQNLEFYDRVENGKDQGNKDLNQIASTMRDMLDSRKKEIQALGTGKLESFIENYLPHIWEDSSKIPEAIKAFSKRPYEGGKSFLKKRSIPTLKEGIELGLKPVSYNPVDMVLLKAREMDRYIMAHRTINELKDQGLVEFVKIGGDRPADYQKINDNISAVYSKGENGELVLRGYYWAQEDVARIINNYLSPGISKNIFYQLYRGAGNTLNQFQLGLSAFHLGFTSMDATISKFALGLNKVAGGDVLGGAKEIASSPLAPVTNIIQGDSLIKAWRGKESSPESRIIADVMAMAGGRAKMDTFYATHFVDRFKTAMGEGKWVTALMQVPWAGVELASKPIMEYIVPRQKAGVFFDMIKMEMERNPQMTHDELRATAQKAWDSVDNRMGQLVYDNLFWDKTVKDLAMSSVRSVGWNLGTIREIGGGAGDLVGTAQGKGLSYRSAYLIALPVVAGIYGAIYQYLRTGEGPKELKDYYFPRSGGLDKNGDPARDSLPTYMKDLYHYKTDPGKTIMNKFGPQNSTIAQMLSNKDFYGTKIRNEDDPIIKQILEESGYVAGQFIPFGIKNQNRSTRKDLPSKILPFVGITSAPYDINMTDAEKRAHEIALGKISMGARTKEQADKSKLKSDIRNEIVANKDYSLLEQSLKDGKITSKDALKIKADVKKDPLLRTTTSFTFEEMATVMHKATPEEKKILMPSFKNKYENALTNRAPEEKPRIKEEFNKFKKE